MATMRNLRTALLALAAIVCFAAAYRFGSHGFRLHDNKCIALSCIALAVGGILCWFAFAKRGQPRGRISG
jgi:hypothetical protein